MLPVTFSPASSASSLRLIASLVLISDFELSRSDVKQAFTKSPLDEEFYLRFPQGRGDMSDTVERLSPAL